MLILPYFVFFFFFLFVEAKVKSRSKTEATLFHDDDDVADYDADADSDDDQESWKKVSRTNKKKVTKLWKDAETKDLLGSTIAMKKLLEEQLDQSNPTRFQKVTQRISTLVGENLNTAIDFSNKKKFDKAAEIYRTIIDNLGNMIDKQNLRYCQDNYAETTYRLALGGHRQWSEVERALKSIESRTPYQDYLVRFAQTNTAMKKANWKSKRDTIKKSIPNLPYVLRFHLPQKYHTPTLAHFGHTMLDGLFPFTLAYANNTFSRSLEHNASIYILDIGLYLLPLFRTVYPNLNFIPFTTHAELPEYYEPIDLVGVGFFEYVPGEPITDPYKTLAGNQNLQTIREVVFSQLGAVPNPKCIVLISRQLQEQNLQSFHQKHIIDESNESPGMNEYHDVGHGVYTAFHYYASTAHERRVLLNEQKVFYDLVKVFHDKYHQCVQLIQLDKLSIREQFLTFMNAKMVIGQHGAALTYSGFMSNDLTNRGILIELDPQYNWNFKFECEGMDVEYHHLEREENPGLYKTEDHVNIEISSKILIKIMKGYLKKWKGYQGKETEKEREREMREIVGSYWDTLYEPGIYNGTSATPSPASILEKEEFAQRCLKYLEQKNAKMRTEEEEDDEDDEDEEEDDLDDDDGDEEDEDEEDEPPPTRVEVCSMQNGKKVCQWKRK